MTRSIFDPGGGETERSGSTFGSEAAGNRSHIPRETVDGEATDEERADADEAAAEENAQAPELTSEEAADETRKTDPDDGPVDEDRA